MFLDLGLKWPSVALGNAEITRRGEVARLDPKNQTFQSDPPATDK